MKKRLLAIVCILVLLVSCIIPGATAATGSEDRYLVGYAIKDMNPWVDPDDHSKGILPVNLTGNSNDTDRVAEGFMDDNDDGVVDDNDGLFATCTAITDRNGTTVMFVTMDVLSSDSTLCDEIRAEIRKVVGNIQDDHILFNASHTHSAPAISSNDSYKAYVISQVATAAAEAFGDRALAVMKKGQIDAKDSTARLGYNDGAGYHMNSIRNYNMQAKNSSGEVIDYVGGSGQSAGKTGTTTADYTSTKAEVVAESDNTMYLLLFEFDESETHKPVVFMNWRAHTTANSSKDTRLKVSSDYVNSIRANLEREGYRAAFFQGAAGNVVISGRADKDWTKECDNEEDTNVYGRILAKVARDCIDRKMTNALNVGDVRLLTRTYNGVHQEDSEGMIAAAQAFVDDPNATGPYAYFYQPEQKTYIINSQFQANSILRRNDENKGHPARTRLALNAVMIGTDVAFVTAPGEISDRYDINGSGADEDNDWRELINAETYGTPFVLGYTNDSKGYIPNWLSYTFNSEAYYDLTGKGKDGPAFFSPGSYESNTSQFAQGCGEAVVQEFKQLLADAVEGFKTAYCPSCDTTVQWSPLNSATLPAKYLSSGHYYLTEDLDFITTRRVVGQTDNRGIRCCLDLNGNKIESDRGAFYVVYSSRLSILDSLGGGQIVCSEGTDTLGGVINLGASSELRIYGGTLRYVRSENAAEGAGPTKGAVLYAEGTVNMYGGELIGGELTPSDGNCGAAVYASGRFYMHGGSITSGILPEGGKGACVYLPYESSRVYLSNDADVDEIYINQNTGAQVTIQGTYTGNADICLDTTNNELNSFMTIGTMADSSSISKTAITAKKHANYHVDNVGTNLKLLGADKKAVLSTDWNTAYDSLESALENYESGVVTLLNDTTEDVTVGSDCYLDLNGSDISGLVTVDTDKTLYCMDSETDDYTVKDDRGYGKISAHDGKIVGVPVEDETAVDSYLMITHKDTNENTTGVSFHRVNLQLKEIVLRPSAAGIYYKSIFGGDEIVAENVKQYGVALSAMAEPTKDNMTTQCQFSKIQGFTAGGHDMDATSTLLSGVMKETNPLLINYRNTILPVYGRAYIQLKNDSYVFGQTKSFTFRQVVEAIDTIWETLSDDQQEGILKMYATYSQIMSPWTIPNIKKAA